MIYYILYIIYDILYMIYYILYIIYYAHWYVASSYTPPHWYLGLFQNGGCNEIVLKTLDKIMIKHGDVVRKWHMPNSTSIVNVILFPIDFWVRSHFWTNPEME